MVIQVVCNKHALIWELTSYNHVFKGKLMNFVLKHLKKQCMLIKDNQMSQIQLLQLNGICNVRHNR